MIKFLAFIDIVELFAFRQTVADVPKKVNASDTKKGQS